MTTVGKIFAVLVLLMSLAVSGLILVWYAKSTPYARAYNEARTRLGNAYDAASTSYQEVIKVKQETKAELDKAEKAMKRLQDENDALRAQVGDKDKQLSDQKNEKIKLDAQVTQMQIEVKKRGDDAEQLRVALEKEQKNNLDLVKLNDKYRQEKALAEIQRDGFKDKNLQLMGQMEQLAKENAKLSLGRGATSTALKVGEKNPPAEKVEALVRGLTDSGLIEIGAGSDSGLARGNTLEAYRLNSTTQKYLGTVRIIEVNHNKAVCVPLGKLVAPIQVGDRVASRILGG